MCTQLCMYILKKALKSRNVDCNSCVQELIDVILIDVIKREKEKKEKEREREREIEKEREREASFHK